MIKAAKVYVTKTLLEECLGFTFGFNIQISRASMIYDRYESDTLVFILTGEGLPDAFAVAEGDRIKEAKLVITKREIEASIEEVKDVQL